MNPNQGAQFSLPSQKKSYSINLLSDSSLPAEIDESYQPNFNTIPTLHKANSHNFKITKNLKQQQYEALTKIKDLQVLAKNIQTRLDLQEKKIDENKSSKIMKNINENILDENSERPRKNTFCQFDCLVF